MAKVRWTFPRTIDSNRDVVQCFALMSLLLFGHFYCGLLLFSVCGRLVGRFDKGCKIMGGQSVPGVLDVGIHVIRANIDTKK